MRRLIVVAALGVTLALLLAGTSVMAMPSAKIVEGEKSVSVVAASLRGALSYGILAESAMNAKLSLGFGAGKLPKIGAATGSSVLGAFLNYNIFEGEEELPCISVIVGVGSLSGENLSATLPVAGLIASQEMDESLSYNLFFAPGFGDAAGRWVFAGEISYKLDEMMNRSGYSLQVGYGYIGGLSAGSAGGVYGGLSFEF